MKTLQLIKSKVIYNNNNDYGIVTIDDESYVIERGFITAKVIFNDIDIECIAEYLSEITYKDLQQYFGYYGLWSMYSIDGSYYLTTTDYYIEPLKDIHFIEVTKWQDSNGNTYHTAMVYYEDLSKEYIPYTYGYGRQWQQTIKERLKRDIDYNKINYKDRIVKRKSDMI